MSGDRLTQLTTLTTLYPQLTEYDMRFLPSSSLILVSLLIAGCAEPSSGPTPRPASGLEASAAKPPSNTLSVTTTFYDADALGNLLLTRSDDKNGTGFATYTEAEGLTSHVASNGAWMMYIGSQHARTLYLVLASQGIPAPDGNYWENVEVFSQCFDQNGADVGILAMTAGSSNGNCSFGLDFTSGRTKYQLVMRPNAPGTGRALVTCLTAANGSCTSWTIVSNPNADNAGVANLYTFNNRGQLVFYGTYHNSYRIGVAQ